MGTVDRVTPDTNYSLPLEGIRSAPNVGKPDISVETVSKEISAPQLGFKDIIGDLAQATTQPIDGVKVTQPSEGVDVANPISVVAERFTVALMVITLLESTILPLANLMKQMIKKLVKHQWNQFNHLTRSLP